MIGFLFSFLVASFLSALSIMGAIALLRERQDYLRAFVTALVATFLTLFLLPYVPINYFFMEIIIWIILMKGVFGFSWKNALLTGIIAYAIKFALSMLGIPGMLVLLIGI